MDFEVRKLETGEVLGLGSVVRAAEPAAATYWRDGGGSWSRSRNAGRRKALAPGAIGPEEETGETRDALARGPSRETRIEESVPWRA